MDKLTLRKFAKDLRKTLDIEALSLEICSQIRNLEQFKQANHVLLFYPKEFEISLLSLSSEEKKFYLPRVEGEKLLVCPYEVNTVLKESNFKVLEPCSNPISPQKIDFAIIPCLIADKKKFRLGYGGGFYDRFLKELNPNCTKVTVVPSSLLCENLPTEAFDWAVDYVVTETGVF